MEDGSPAPPLARPPEIIEPPEPGSVSAPSFINVFALALADLQGAQQILVDAHESEVQFLRNEVARLLGKNDLDSNSMRLRDCGSPGYSALTTDFPPLESEDKALESSQLLEGSLAKERISNTPTDERTVITERPACQPSPTNLGARTVGSSNFSNSEKLVSMKNKASVRMSYEHMRCEVNMSERDPFSWAAVKLGRNSDAWRAFIDARRLPCEWAEKLINGRMFEILISAIIASNVIFILIDIDYTVKAALARYDHRHEIDGDAGVISPELFAAFDWCFLVVFCVEILIRIIAEELRFFFGRNWKSNMFDLLIVAMTLAEFFLIGFGIDATFARLFRLVRLSRAMKIVRVFKAFSELRVLLDSCFHIFFPLVWSALAMAVVIAFVSVTLLYGVVSYSQSASLDDENMERLRSYFHSLPMCALSLFMALTGGESWWLILDPLLGISFTYGLVFVAYVTFMQLGVLNIVTSIFVQNAANFSQMDSDMIELAAAENQKQLMRQLREVFQYLDGDGSGAISIGEFERLTENPKIKALFERVVGQEAWKVGRFFKLLDVDGDEMIEREEFVVGCIRLRGGAKNMDQAILRNASKTMKRDLKQVKRDIDRVKLALNRVAGSQSSVHNSLERVAGASLGAMTLAIPEKSVRLA